MGLQKSLVFALNSFSLEFILLWLRWETTRFGLAINNIWIIRQLLETVLKFKIQKVDLGFLK